MADARPDDLADLTEDEQVALLTQTDNGLAAEDEDLPQPPQDPTWVPEEAS